MNLPPYPEFPILTSERISLNQVSGNYIKDILEISFYDGKKAGSLEEGLDILLRIEKDYLNSETIHWGIFENNTNKIVGTCGYYRGFKNNSGELGCVLLKKSQGFGFMKEALELAINFGLKTMNLEKIIAITTVENTKAILLLERLGFLYLHNGIEGNIKFIYQNKLNPSK